MQILKKKFSDSYWTLTSEEIFEKAMEISQECI